MIRHLFKLMWNQKRKNLGLLTEVFFSFLVIFAVFSFIVYNAIRYREPLGFDYDRIWVLRFNPNMENAASYDAFVERVNAQIDQIDQQIGNYPEFESYSFSSENLPYLGNQMITSLKYEGKQSSAHIQHTDEHFARVMNIPLVAGRWFNEGDMDMQAANPIVINRQLKEALFGPEEAVGKRIEGEEGAKARVIVGVVDNFKQQGEFAQALPRFFQPPTNQPFYTLAIKVKPGADAAVEARLFEDIQQITRDWTVEINYMDELRSAVLKETLIPALIFLIISGFLIFNVALGLFGVVWQNINKRKQEIGVRRAMGASKAGIRTQITGEIVVLATLSLALGVFFAIQFPLLNVFNLESEVYLIAILLAILFIYAIVLICSYYPSRLAAGVHPAVALHEE